MDATRIVPPDAPNEAILFPEMAVYVHTHEPGETGELHTHGENHVLVMRSGRMRWTLRGESVETTAGWVLVVPAGVEHGFEVLGDEDVRLLCIESPNPQLRSSGAPDPTPAPPH